MDIIKAFVFHNCKYDVSVIVDHDGSVLLKAGDVGKAIGLQNISMTIRNFEETERVVRPITYTGENGGTQVNDTVFLTEPGVYRLLFICRKPIAKPFRTWVYEILKNIRKHGQYSLNDSLQEKNKEIARVHQHNDIQIALCKKHQANGSYHSQHFHLCSESVHA